MVWSATPRPISKHPEEESVIFNEDRVEFAHQLAWRPGQKCQVDAQAPMVYEGRASSQ